MNNSTPTTFKYKVPEKNAELGDFQYGDLIMNVDLKLVDTIYHDLSTDFVIELITDKAKEKLKKDWDSLRD